MTVPVKRNTAGQTVYVMLFSGANIVTTPTIAAGDFKACLDGLAEANPTVLPFESPVGSGWVAWTPTQAETNGAVMRLRWVDAAGAEWDDGGMSWRTSTSTLADIATSISTVSITTVSAVSGSAITVYNYGDWVFQIQDTAIDLSDAIANGVHFIVKDDPDDADNDALLWIQETVGLIRINGAAAADPTKGTLVPLAGDDGVDGVVFASVTGFNARESYTWMLKKVTIDADRALPVAVGQFVVLDADARTITV